MKKLLILLSAILLLVGCGSTSSGPQSATPAPTVSMAVNPTEIDEGESATLTWTTTNATSVEIEGLPDATSPSGVIVVTPTTTTAYTIRALGPGGTSAPLVLTLTVNFAIPSIPGSSDDDHDGVSNLIDICPFTPSGTDVDGVGCPVPMTGVVTATVTWDLPTQYTDGTLIEQAALDNLVTRIYMKTTPEAFVEVLDLPIGESAYGATSLIISDVTVTLGQTYYFSARAHVAPEGPWSEFAPKVEHTWPTP